MEAMFAPPPPPLTARDLIQQARAASRATAEPRPRGRGRPVPPESDVMFAGMRQTRPHKPTQRRRGSTLMTALMVSFAGAALSVSVAGYVILFDKPAGPVPARVAQSLGAKAPPAATTKGAADGSSILAATAVIPGTDMTADAATPAAPSADAIALYGEGARRIEAHDFTGVKALTKAANLGYAPAQFYLAKLYEEGSAGLKKDSAEARRWTERAAEGGDRKAMHNLALYYFEGTGGPKNTTTAAEWFRRAADLGLTDSQYNLGRLYEEGFGVAQNPAEAYKWYLIAAQGGDADSRASALRVKGELSAEAQSAAERAAQSFHAAAPGAAPAPMARQDAPASPVANAQRALSHLGYYQGPTDGTASPALKFAIAAYQRDQGLPATGQLDPTLNDRLSLIAQ
jgi:localization factor PodJL